MLFVTTSKVRDFLQLNGPDVCVQKFGCKARSPFFKLIFSNKEDIQIRKSAIEALTLLGIYDSVTKKLNRNNFGAIDFHEFPKKWEQFPNELKDVFLKFSFSEKANKETKLFFIALFGSGNKTIRNEIENYVSSHNCKHLCDLFVGCLQDRDIHIEIRVACVEMLLMTQGIDADALLKTLRDCSVVNDDFLVDHIADILDRLESSNPELEDVLINQLQKIPIYSNALASLQISNIDALSRLYYHDKYGWILNPHGRIIQALSHKGGIKALKAMLEIWWNLMQTIAAPERSNSFRNELYELYGLDSESAKAMLKTNTRYNALLIVNLSNGIFELYHKLENSGEIRSIQDIEELNRFLAVYGQNNV